MMTAREKKEIATLVADIVCERMRSETDKMMPIDELCSTYGWSHSYVYKNVALLGGVKAGGRLFFSRKNIETFIRTQTR